MRQGKVRYFGLSNYRASRPEICNICDWLGFIARSSANPITTP